MNFSPGKTDRIRWQETCNKFDTGLTVVAIRVTKPRIPDSVRQNYEHVERATSELQVRLVMCPHSVFFSF